MNNPCPTDRPITAFFELEGWEEPYLREHLPDVEIRDTRDRLEPGRLVPLRALGTESAIRR